MSNLETLTVTFRDRSFIVARGSLHPGYSFFTFEEERDIRETYWDVKEGQVVVDVGASYGSYSLTACVMGATVIAFEPEPLVFADLMTNLRLNGWLETRGHAFNAGLWDETAERVPMESYAPHWPKQTISGPYRMTSLDKFSLMNPALLGQRIDWIKVDVEGAEERVLRGGAGCIRRFRPRMLVECHTFLDPELKDRVVSQLRSIHPDYTFLELERTPCVTLVIT